MLRNIILLIFLVVPFAAAEQDFQEVHSEIHPVAASNNLHIQWRVGDLHIIKGTDPNNIHIRYTIRAKRESDLKKAKVEFQAHENSVNIDADSSFRGNTSIDADIEVPDPMNLDVHLKVGEVRVEGIHGNKTLDVNVGDIRVGMGNEPEYRTVRARTHIGDVSWSGDAGDGRQVDRLHENGWLGKKLSYESNGKYELSAEVSVGDIQLQ